MQNPHTYLSVLFVALQRGMPYTILQYSGGRSKAPRKETIMSTIKSFDDALDFFPRQPVSALSRFWTTLRIYLGAMSDGLAAARYYHQLTGRGVPHDVAVQKIFGEHFNGR